MKVSNEDIEISVVIPCLNEDKTIGFCVTQALNAIQMLHLKGEVIVADNGSEDGSIQIAVMSGAKVIRVIERGYGNALKVGMSSAKGSLLIMADGDASYDFSSLRAFIEEFKRGSEVVIGNRFKGKIESGAMPWMNRRIGNPFLTVLCRLLFTVPVGDVCCGFRGLTREAFRKMDLKSGGMEFAAEMIIESEKLSLRIGEVPVDLKKDGRLRPSHLRIWRDGWLTLTLMIKARIRRGFQKRG